MAVYPPPTENLPIFDNSVFIVPAGVEINIAKASQYFLRFPVAQGAETLLDTNINGDLALDGNLSFHLGGSGEIIFADGTTQNTAGGGGGWVGTATSDLNMNIYNINGSTTSGATTYTDQLTSSQLDFSQTGSGNTYSSLITADYMTVQNATTGVYTYMTAGNTELHNGAISSSVQTPSTLTYNGISGVSTPTNYAYGGINSTNKFNISTTNGLSLQTVSGTVGQVVTADGNGNPIWSTIAGSSGLSVLGTALIPVVSATGANNTTNNLVLTSQYNLTVPVNGTFPDSVNRMNASIISGGGNPGSLSYLPVPPVTGQSFATSMCGNSSSGMMITTSTVTATPNAILYTYKPMPKPDIYTTVQWSGIISCAPDPLNTTISKITVISTSSGIFPTEAQLLGTGGYFVGAFLKIITPNFNSFNVEIIESVLTSTSCTVRNSAGGGYTFSNVTASIYLLNTSSSANNFVGITTTLNSALITMNTSITGQSLTNIQPGDIVFITGARVLGKATGYNSMMNWGIVTTTNGSISFNISSITCRTTFATIPAGTYNALFFKAGSPVSFILNTNLNVNYCMVNSGSSGADGLTVSQVKYTGGQPAPAATSVTSVALSSLTITNSSVGILGTTQSIPSYPTGLNTTTINPLYAPIASTLSPYSASRSYTGNGLQIVTAGNLGYGAVYFNYLYQA